MIPDYFIPSAIRDSLPPQSAGGTASGTCASGFGVCCVVSKTCGGSSSTNNTYLEQTTTTVAASCSYTICPISTDICGIRIEFETFVMAGASSSTFTKGDCVDDSLVVSSPGAPAAPRVCGTLSGQHMYLPYASSCHTFTASIGATDTSTSRSWSMRVAQIECTNPLLPPSGCLQYMTGTTGYIQSFGWNGNDAGTTVSTAAHQNNQRYSICFRREEGYCSMEYSTPAAAFSVGGDSSIAGQSLFGDLACFEDYLQIPDIYQAPTTSTATATVTVVGSRICGRAWTQFPSPSTTASTLVSEYSPVCFAPILTCFSPAFTKPFKVVVNFDGEDEAADDAQIGFSILYTQKACA